MSILIIIGLIALIALWHDMIRLRGRVALLELALPYQASGADIWTSPPDGRVQPEHDNKWAVEPEPIATLATAIDADLTSAPASTAASSEPPSPTPSPVPTDSAGGFEELFGRRLPIWAGGVTLTVAGFLLVRLSIEAGLLSPMVRVVLGLLFGTLLIGGAEIARRADDWVADGRIPQSLAGAGIGTLYAAILVAANLYALIGGMAAFAALAAVTLLAGWLSIRFGAPSAILGLAGGLAAPALVGEGPANVPLLAAYLALAVGGMCALARGQRWWWLGAAALAGGFGWGLLLILDGAVDVAGSLAIGGYTLLLGVGLPLLLLGDRRWIVQGGAAAAGTVQMAVLVAAGAFGPLDWSLYGLLSGAVVWLALRDARLAMLPPIGLGTGVMLMLLWPAPDAGMLALVLIGAVVIYGSGATWRLRSGGIVEAAQIAALGAMTGLLPLYHFPNAAAWQLSGAFLVGALLAAVAAALLWRVAERRGNARFATLSITAAGLVGLATAVGTDAWMLPPALALLALALRLLGTAAADERVVRGAWAFSAAAALAACAATAELQRAFGLESTGALDAVLRWLIPAGVAAFLSTRVSSKTEAAVAQSAALLLLTVAIAQLLPLEARAPAAALLLAGAALIRLRTPAILCAAFVVIGWALPPLAIWFVNGAIALGGRPFYVSDLPTVRQVILQLAPAAAALCFAQHRALPNGTFRRAARIAAAAAGLVTTHVLFKQIVAIDTWPAFEIFGMAQRTAWELLLTVTAVGCWRLGLPRAATLFGGLALAHFAWFTGLVLNPLWVAQAVGPWLLPAYATAFTLVVLSARVQPNGARLRDGAAMALILLFAVSALRQVAHGSVLLDGGTSGAEDVARSLLMVTLGIGFLLTGIRRGSRDWRIASLALMLGAAVKVFLIDAASLDGLLRIGSFAALGASLIGIGWLYSRYLPARSRKAAP